MTKEQIDKEIYNLEYKLIQLKKERDIVDRMDNNAKCPNYYVQHKWVGTGYESKSDYEDYATTRWNYVCVNYGCRATMQVTK